MGKLVTILMVSALALTSLSAKEKYYNIDGERITEAISDECESALLQLVKAKDKSKLYLKVDDFKMSIHSAQKTLRWSIEAKAECTGTIPGDWEKELDGYIKDLPDLIKRGKKQLEG